MVGFLLVSLVHHQKGVPSKQTHPCRTLVSLTSLKAAHPELPHVRFAFCPDWHLFVAELG